MWRTRSTVRIRHILPEFTNFLSLFLLLFLLLSDKKRRHETIAAIIVAMSASDRPKRDWAEDPRPGGRQRAHRQTCGSGVEAREHPNRLQPPSSGNTTVRTRNEVSNHRTHGSHSQVYGGTSEVKALLSRRRAGTRRVYKSGEKPHMPFSRW